MNDNIRNERIRGTIRVVHSSKKTLRKRLKWYGYVMRINQELLVRRMLDVHIPRLPKPKVEKEGCSAAN